jgi:HEAT repeat protein
METMDETARLYQLLDLEDAPPTELDQLPGFSDEAKDDVVARIARTQAPAPGRVLARLVMIRTGRNEEDMAAAFLTGLRSAEPDARKFALYGLEQLGHPTTADEALRALADDDDRVVTAAVTILLPRAAADPRIAAALREAYEARRGREEFHMSTSLLEARLIEPGEPR